jgi:hypothetical protein
VGHDRGKGLDVPYARLFDAVGGDMRAQVLERPPEDR